MIFRKWSVVECRDPGSNTGRTWPDALAAAKELLK
jgi:hypothetical protein